MCHRLLLLLFLVIATVMKVPKVNGYAIELPVAGIDNSAWYPYLQMGNGIRRVYLQRREVVSQRDLYGQYPNAQYFVDGPERVFYRRILTPIYSTQSACA